MAKSEYIPKTWEKRLADWLEVHDACQDAALEGVRAGKLKGVFGVTDLADRALKIAENIRESHGGSDYDVDTDEEVVRHVVVIKTDGG